MKHFAASIGALVALRNLRSVADATDALTPEPAARSIVVFTDPEPKVTPVGRSHTPRGGKYMPHQGKREIARRLRRSAP